MMNEQNALLRKIDVISFHMDDTRLFLDTHPDCCEALSYFEKLCKVRCALMDEYTEKFGPLSAYQSFKSDCRAWTDGPQPWEIGGNS